MPDRIKIVSHPGADRSITEEGLRTYRVWGRRYRNRRIGEFLKEMHLTEGRNTGFRKILNALEQNGSPKPIFETDPDRLSFCTTLLIHPDFLHQNEGENEGENEGLSEKEADIYLEIKKNPSLTASKIAAALGISKSTVERSIKVLKEKGYIVRYGSARSGYWKING